MGIRLWDPTTAHDCGVTACCRSAISASFENLLHHLVPSNLVGIFFGPNGSVNLLSVISFAIVFSLALMLQAQVPDTPHALMPFIQELLDTVLIIIMWVIDCTPVAVGSLILSAIGSSSLSAIGDAMSSLGVVVAGCIAVNIFHATVVLPGLAFLVTRKNPYVHLRGMIKAVGVSAGSASSAVTLPVNIECCEELGYDPSITRFSLSLGATISMDGSAIIYLAVTLWLGAVAGQPNGAATLVSLILITVLSSMGASPTPGMVATLILIFGSVYGTEKPVPP